MEEYKLLNKIGEGSFGVIKKAKNITNGKYYALKRVNLHSVDDHLPCSIFREIQALHTLSFHPNIIKLHKVIPYGIGIYLVFDLMKIDLNSLLNKVDKPLRKDFIKYILLMLLRGVNYMHENSIMHRDLKPSNLLLSYDGELKIADFGLCRTFSQQQQQQQQKYSHQVATRWYRSIELLFGAKYYDESMDMWSIGTIFGELLKSSPLFPGDNDIDQIYKIFKILGTPNNKDCLDQWPDYNKINFSYLEPIGLDNIIPNITFDESKLIHQFIQYNPNDRIAARDALKASYFYSSKQPPMSSMKVIQYIDGFV